ncbi:MAG: hypothetical protein ACRCTQ_04005 [Brevinemataceae bacterium]
MEKAKPKTKTPPPIPSTNQQMNKKKKSHHIHKPHSHKDRGAKPPIDWVFESRFKAKPFTETKADLLKILAETDPEEILITPLIHKKKSLPLVQNTVPKNIPDKEEPTEQQNTPKININVSLECPICNKTIREIMYALHDYEHDKLAHFDCVYKKVTAEVKPKLTTNRYLAYLGSGSFGIMESKNNKIILIEKIYPGAPVEELLHGGEIPADEEI